jgi:pimeloyl-ACP methyl ester carboxylesterase
VNPSPPEAHSGYVSTRGIRFHFLDWGPTSAPTILLLHGGSAHAHWWDFCAPALAVTYRVLALDLRGHGDTSWPDDADYSVQAHADDVLAFAAALGRPIGGLVGHSFGGQVAAAVAERLRPSALVLIDSRLHVTERIARLMEGLSRLPHPIYATLEESVEKFRLLPSATSADARVLRHVARHAVRQREDGTWILRFDRRAIPNRVPCNLSPRLETLGCPVLLVRGAQSDIMTPAVIGDVQHWVPHAKVVEIAAAHHHIMLDAPDALVQVLLEFLTCSLKR